ncbi:MAG TPA: Ig-like domain-containing protein [bacterium]|nr:Ig-like domain-containing protein [bacterium]
MSRRLRFAAALFLVWGIVGLSTTRVMADPQTFHIIDINEVYTNADGSKQFIELFAGSAGQTNLAPTWLIALNADGTDTNVVFDFTALFPALDANETILLATAAMADDLGFSPDFIIPANSIFLGNGRVIFEDPPPFPTMVDAVAYGNYTGSNTNFGSPAPALPSDGCRSLVRNIHDYILPKDNAAQWGIASAATPRNNAGQTTTLTCPPVAPVLASIGPRNVNEGQLLAFGVSASDGNGDPLTLAAESLPAGAVFTDNGNGTGNFSWTPGFTQSGAPVVRFIVSDGALADSELVTITVNEVTDPPVARDSAVAAQEDTPLGVTLQAFDPDGDPIPRTVASGPFHGSLQVINANAGTYTYAPAQDYFGPDSVRFTVNDGFATSNTGTLRIDVAAVNDPPVAADANFNAIKNTLAHVPALPVIDVDDVAFTVAFDLGPFHGTVSNFNAANGSFDYTPDLDYVGPDSIRYHADDGDGPGNTATIRINVAEGCDCSCHADPVCDQVPNIQDVVSVVNIAFRGGADTVDPQCTHIGRADLNCDCVVSVLDVVSMVNHAFRGDASPFCDACASPCP